MVLKQQRSSIHNEMLGHRQTTLLNAFIKQSKTESQPEDRPPTPKHEHDGPQRPNKRRRLSGPDEDSLKIAAAPKAISPIKSKIASIKEVKESTRSRQPAAVPDSDEESGNEDLEEQEPSSTQRTDLEQALPPIATDKEAIAEYETLRAQEDTSNLQDRLGTRKWVQGKSSIYVDAFNLALETVLDEESHLFDEAETRVFEEWRALSYEAQYL